MRGNQRSNYLQAHQANVTEKSEQLEQLKASKNLGQLAALVATMTVGLSAMPMEAEACTTHCQTGAGGCGSSC